MRIKDLHYFTGRPKIAKNQENEFSALCLHLHIYIYSVRDRVVASSVLNNVCDTYLHFWLH